ncbi:MAG: ABC transporter substrate-binding protein [Nostoc sp.]|uniref:ABC transporter substrate-binding protein n=1 Tax=Nostoc sp. TaxID=1180 RepID=UPI002FFADA5A
MRFKRFRTWSFLIGLALLAFGFVACASGNQTASQTPEKVTIAYQPGINYANLLIVKQQQTLEKKFPRTQFAWKELSNGGAIRDGIIANQIQVGAGGPGSFLVGWDKGVGWKILASLNYSEFWLITKNPNIKSIKDFKPEMKIGLPSLDGVQAIVLRKVAQKDLGNPTALDQNLQVIAHPLGLQSLLTGQIDAHFTTPPFQFQEVEKGGRVIIKSSDIFGKTSIASVFTTEKFYNQYPEFGKALYTAIVDATKLVNEKPEEAAKILSDIDGGKVSQEQYKKWLTNKAVAYGIEPRAFLKCGAFMHEIGMLNKQPKSIEELILPPLKGAGGD